jgi:SP family galactose:H+ symporter-like MFS transporter
MFGLAVLPSLLLFAGMTWLPRSPRWLVEHNEPNKAAEVLARFEDEPRHAMQQIEQEIHEEHAVHIHLGSPEVRPALLIGLALAITQQVTGINTIIYYAPSIFEMAGIGSAAVSILATFGIGLLNVGVTIGAIWLVDRVERRPLLLVGTAGMVVSSAVLGWASHGSHVGDVLPTVTTVCLAVYVGSFAVGLGPVFWLLISEIYPLVIRGRAMGLATVSNWLSNLAVTLTFLSLVAAWGRANVFWLYAAIGCAGWFFMWRFVPETRGRTLEEINAHWRRALPDMAERPGGISGTRWRSVFRTWGHAVIGVLFDGTLFGLVSHGHCVTL